VLPVVLVLGRLLEAVLRHRQGDVQLLVLDRHVHDAPGQRELLLADAEHAARAEHDVRDHAFIRRDHDFVDLADVLVVGRADARALQIPREDQAVLRGALPRRVRLELRVLANQADRRAVDRSVLLADRRALDLLLSQPQVDKARVGYVGHDFGAMYGMLMAGVEKRLKTYVFIAATQSLNDWAFLGPQPKSKAAYLKQNASLELTDYLRQATNASKFFQFGKADFYISQADAAVVFAAAPQPKQRKMYEASHQMELKEIMVDRDNWLIKELIDSKR